MGENTEYFLDEIGFTEYPYLNDENTFGYSIIDINNDGIPELLLGTTYGLKNAAACSIFTLLNNEPSFVETFWPRSRGTIGADGIIYNVGSGGMPYQ